MFDQDPEAMTVTGINSNLALRIQEELGENVFLCYQCVKCTSGCPLAAFFDWQPNQIMRALQLGQEDIALHSNTPWLCASCQTCSTRCPQGLDIAAIMDFLTREAALQGYEIPNHQAQVFNEAFLRQVHLWGRAYEPGLMVEMKLRTLGQVSLLADADLYLRMLRKRKVGFFPSLSHPSQRTRPLAEASSSVAYYPGCSLHSTATEFNVSARAVCEALDIALIEPKEWVCCGSSAAHRHDPGAAITLPMQNLAAIEQSGFHEVTMPCAACFNRHKAALHEIKHDPNISQKVAIDFDYEYQDTVKVNTLTTTIHDHAGVDAVRDRVKNPLTDIKAVCYYGCLLTRPPAITEAQHPENPTDMDELVAALGMEVRDWSYKTSCCGAAHSITRPDIVISLSEGLIKHAQAAGADVVVVACPLCHMNLDARQFQMNLDQPIPILYFTQLMALAFDLPADAAALHKNLTDPRPLLQRKHVL